MNDMELEELDGYIRENWDSIREQIRTRSWRNGGCDLSATLTTA